MTIIELMNGLQGKNGWSQNEFGRQLGLPQGQLSDILKGKRPITIQLLQRLHELGGGSIEKLHQLALVHEEAREETKFSARLQRATAQAAAIGALVLGICSGAVIPGDARASVRNHGGEGGIRTHVSH